MGEAVTGVGRSDVVSDRLEASRITTIDGVGACGVRDERADEGRVGDGVKLGLALSDSGEAVSGVGRSDAFGSDGDAAAIGVGFVLGREESDAAPGLGSSAIWSAVGVGSELWLAAHTGVANA